MNDSALLMLLLAARQYRERKAVQTEAAAWVQHAAVSDETSAKTSTASLVHANTLVRGERGARR